MRGLGGAFADWGAVYGQVGRGLRVGGSVEVSDCGWIRMEEGWESGCLRRYNELVKAAAEKAGRPLGLDHLDGRYFERAGLHVVKSKTFDVPLGVWAREPQRRVAGKMALIVALEGLEATGLRLLVREMGLGVQEVKELCGGVRREVEGGRAFVPYSFVVARKLVMG